MDSPSLKVQCQAALALRNLASDGGSSSVSRVESGMAVFLVPLLTCCNSTPFGAARRTLPSRDRQAQRPPRLVAPPQVVLLAARPLGRRVRPQRLDPPAERVAHHRGRLPRSLGRSGALRCRSGCFARFPGFSGGRKVADFGRTPDRPHSSRSMSMKRSSAMPFRRSGTSPPRARTTSARVSSPPARCLDSSFPVNSLTPFFVQSSAPARRKRSSRSC